MGVVNVGMCGVWCDGGGGRGLWEMVVGGREWWMRVMNRGCGRSLVRWGWWLFA